MSKKIIDFNLNENVRVKLTKFGKDELKRQYLEMFESYPKPPYEFELPKEDSDGYSSWQMHSLMNRFGRFFYLVNTDLPFDMDIKLEIEDM